jgi:transcriptional regulator, AsnC family
MELDDTDRAILKILQEDARTAFSEIARRIDMSSATVHDRVGRMEDEGIIKGYHANVDPRAVGYGVAAFVGLRVEKGGKEETLDRLREIEQIRELHLTTGEWDVMMKIVADDTDALRELMFNNVATVDGFARSQTMVILGTDQDEPGVPV